MWEYLCEEEIRRLTKAGSSSKGARIKIEEEEYVALTSVGQQGKRKKKEISKVKFSYCGELGDYATHYPRKKNKGEAFDSMAALAKAKKEFNMDDDCSMSDHAPQEKRWGDIEL